MVKVKAFENLVHNYIAIGLGQDSGRPSLRYFILNLKEIPLLCIIIAKFDLIYDTNILSHFEA